MKTPPYEMQIGWTTIKGVKYKIDFSEGVQSSIDKGELDYFAVDGTLGDIPDDFAEEVGNQDFIISSYYTKHTLVINKSDTTLTVLYAMPTKTINIQKRLPNR